MGDAQGNAVSDGEQCVDGAMGFSSPYYGGLMKRKNWQDIIYIIYIIQLICEYLTKPIGRGDWPCYGGPMQRRNRREVHTREI